MKIDKQSTPLSIPEHESKEQAEDQVILESSSYKPGQLSAETSFEPQATYTPLREENVNHIGQVCESRSDIETNLVDVSHDI